MNKLYGEGTHWWITGASSGIGRELVLQLAAQGMALSITSRSSDSLEELAKECMALGAKNCFAAPADLTNSDDMDHCYSKILAENGPISVLVANAGTYLPTDAKEFSVSKAIYEMSLNYGGMVRCVGAVLPSMLERKSGHIVAVSSVAGFRGLPKAAGYGASKAAVTHFLESLRFDVAEYNIRVTAVHPGFVRTPLTDKNEFPMPFLIDSDEAAERIIADIQQGAWESHFPRRFSCIMKILRVLPQKTYSKIIKLVTKEKG